MLEMLPLSSSAALLGKSLTHIDHIGKQPSHLLLCLVTLTPLHSEAYMHINIGLVSW